VPAKVVHGLRYLCGGEKQDLASIQQFTEAANSSCQYVIAFTSLTDKRAHQR
jgi:hypothetical protein